MQTIENADNLVTVVPFDETHINPLIEILFRLRRMHGVYPPRQDAATTVPGYRTWLLEEKDAVKFVALLNGKVVGHVQHTPAHNYLVDHFDSRPSVLRPGFELGEIDKLFADLELSHHGIGAALLRTVRDSSWAHGLQPSLVALDSSRTAMRLCEDEGMAQLGDFFGLHGHSNVWIDLDAQT